MPIHDWTRVDVGVFHGFHLRWISHLTAWLNKGGLPSGYYTDAGQYAAFAGSPPYLRELLNQPATP